MPNLVVEVEQGQLRGKADNDIKGREFFSFLGVPYAKPPVGSLRFKSKNNLIHTKAGGGSLQRGHYVNRDTKHLGLTGRGLIGPSTAVVVEDTTIRIVLHPIKRKKDLRIHPQPPDPWDGIREATEPGNFCYGTDLLLTAEGTALAKEGGSEDCLFLNIFTHELNRDVKVLKPVMLYIHGGGFTVGSSNPLLYGPHILMMEEIVLVTINYRTGALGFLSVDSEEIGNSGLKDMVQALKWVQRNIEVFGGDPSNVTIFGESAGGASVHYLVLSPLTKGLFHKAIAQSGNAINCWARGTKNNHILLAKALGCTESDDKAILSFLREQPVAKIFEGQRILKDPLDASVIRYFAPTVENSSPTAFLTEEPLQVIKSGKFNQVPFMTGYTDQEGLLMFIVDAIHMTLGLEDSVPYFLGFEKGSKEHSDVNKEIHQFFFGQDTLDHKNVPRKIDEEKHTNEATEQVVQPISAHIKTIGKSLPSGADISKVCATMFTWC